MSRIFLVDLESVPTRYTCEWKTFIPQLLEKEGHDVRIIDGPTDIPPAVTQGAFLNFGGTNVYKAVQVEKFSRLFCSGSVNPGDHFLFTDAWHPGIINLKYMSELLDIPVKIHALWHAGSYDKWDFLGRLIGDAPWVRHAEKSFYESIDFNYFATQFHIKMFSDNLLKSPIPDNNKIIRTGWPMGYMKDLLSPYRGEKENLILFPHRIAPEKQVEIFRDLAACLPQYKFVVCQDQELTKEQYHALIGRAKMIFSCSLQETLGIGCYEGALLGAIPLVPDRLSYQEMYFENFKYPSIWTENWNAYIANRDELCRTIIGLMEGYNNNRLLLEKQASSLIENYFTCGSLLRNLK